MTSYLDFEKPIAEIRRQAPGASPSQRRQRRQHARRGFPPRGQGRPAAEADLQPPHSLAEDTGRPSPAPAPLLRLHLAPRDRLRAAGRRSRLRRGQGRHRRLGRFRGHTTMVIGQEKGADTEGRVAHNFGMANPEGYRKAARLLRLAERFQVPVLTLIDTPGAHPGVGAEERGQAEAIARCIEVSLDIRVPVVALIIGEGGSGGAIALGTANRVLMMGARDLFGDLAEGCASILWRDAGHAEAAAEALRLTSEDLQGLASSTPSCRSPWAAHIAMRPVPSIRPTRRLKRRSPTSVASMEQDCAAIDARSTWRSARSAKANARPAPFADCGCAGLRSPRVRARSAPSDSRP